MKGFSVMGVVNVTPDSFSDGGRWLEPDAAVDHALAMVAEGAMILDVGGESTRPGAEPVTADQELQRVIPVIEGITAARPDGVRISIDTAKADVAEAALAAGADVINDVTAFTGDSRMAEVAAASDCQICLMHMQGEPRTMQDDPAYSDVVAEVGDYLQAQVEGLKAAGIDRSRIWLDPGIGFGKTAAHNLELLNRLDEIVALGHPVLLGASRKSFIGKISGAGVADRLPGSIASAVIGLERGASIFRVHDVAETVQALEIAAACRNGMEYLENAER